jgi:hypothetical protein
MAAALLAKLKINNPPALQKTLEIKINGDKAAPVKALEKVPVEKGPTEQPMMKVVTFIDESRQGQFDRNDFLKSFKKPIIINSDTVIAAPLVPAPLVPEPLVPAPLVPKKRTLKPKITKKTQALVEAAIAEEPAIAAEEPAIAAEEPAAIAEPAIAAEPSTKPLKVAIRRTKKPLVGVKEGPMSMLTIGDTDIETRLHRKKAALPIIPASAYYLNNREIFVNFMTSLFGKYKKQLANEAAAPATCPGDNDVNEFSLMTHQQIVRDYLNLYSPYRGLLLYHGLGSGKTCSSIAIAEGLKSAKPIIVMTPASLQVNYREELKKCGDDLYRKNQFWEFIKTSSQDDAELVENLSKVLSLSVEYIDKAGGAWVVNMAKPSNYDTLTPSDKIKLDQQIDQMIMHKYKFINYNGLRASKIVELTKNNTINPFDNAVVIVDEAHNLVSRIVNKIGRKSGSIATSLYSLLMKAKNAKIVLLSGTPIINFPNEISILYNILRGYITSWSFKLDIMEQRQVTSAYFQSLFKSTVLGGNVVDLIDYKASNTTLVITRNPFGFVNKTSTKDNTYAGVKLEIGDRGELSDAKFVELITQILKKNNIKIQASGVSVHEYKALPDTLDAFKSYFIEENGDMKNDGMFKRRILGLTSYFRSAQESLMPRYVKSNPNDFKVIKIPMSDFQLEIYEEARIQERTQERKNAMKSKVKKPGVEGLYENTTSTYRIFSRAFCNFVFPSPAIARPMPDKKNKVGEETDLAGAIGSEGIDEDAFDDVSAEEKKNRDESFAEGAEEAGEGAVGEGSTKHITYRERIKNALHMLEKDSAKYLSPAGLQVYSPKFLNILENIQDEDHLGIHLIYTQFRALEGIGILKLVLETNGFAQFKIKKAGANWELHIEAGDEGKPMFALYTGTETTEEKEIIRNVLNNAWKYVPETITRKLKTIAKDNTMGDIIKVLMITSSGAEGISLKNVRYVHITEPYWHPVRIEQVIGRARRICSHQALPEALRTVTVFLYLMTFSPEQLASETTIELRLRDKSRKDDMTPVSTDETLYEIATAKEEITANIMTAVKESSIDCALHIKSNAAEKLKCFTFGSSGSSKFAYMPAFEDEQSDAIADKNQKEIEWKAKQIEVDGVKYALNKDTNEVYDLDSYMNGRPVKIADLIISKGKGKEAAAFRLEFI